MEKVIEIVITVLIFAPAIILHEVAHGYVALLLGDPTARDRKRLTLNPIRHIDPFGTILLPLLLAASPCGLPVIGYAKPVPVNPWNFRGDKRLGMLLSGAAGPATNIVLALVSGLLVRVVSSGILGYLLVNFCFLNLGLAFFNLIPIPPLDGSRVLQYFLPDRALQGYQKIERFGFVILLAVVWLLPEVAGAYFNATVNPLFRLITGLNV